MAISSVTPSIDLSRLPAPAIIEDVSYEELLHQRMIRLKQRLAEEGFTYDVSELETDPAKILQEEDAYRQMLDRQRVNDALKAVLPAYARASDLDATALRAGVMRQQIGVAKDEGGQDVAVYESDECLRQRYLAAFGRPAAGSIDGYIYATLTAVPALHDVTVLGPEYHGRPGVVEIILLPKPNENLPDAATTAVAKATNANNTRPLTDYVMVRAATIIPYTVEATLTLPMGPDPQVVVRAAHEQMRTMAAARYKLSSEELLPANAIAAALYVANVRQVKITSPLADIALQPDAAPLMVGLSIRTEILS